MLDADGQVTSIIRNPLSTSVFMASLQPLADVVDGNESGDAILDAGEAQEEDALIADDPFLNAFRRSDQSRRPGTSTSNLHRRYLPGARDALDVMHQELREAELLMEEFITGGHSNATKASTAFSLLRKYERNSSMACYLLGIMYKTNRFNMFNLTTAHDYFFKSIDLAGANYPTAQFELALLAEHFGFTSSLPTRDDGVPFGMNRRVKSLIHHFQAAMAGSFQSQMALGFRHAHGVQGAPKSCMAAANYYKLAATYVVDQVDTTGASTTLNGDTVANKLRLTDDDAATLRKRQEDVMDYYEYSANKGSARSKLVVGYAHMFGMQGMAQNPQLARNYFEQLAAQDEPEAFGPLGQMYLKGMEGVPADNATAHDYFKRGADMGDSNSMNGLGYMYLNGVHVKRDYERAFQLFNSSAHLGNAEAQYNLGVLYLTAPGRLARSYEQAFHWFTLAAQQGQLLAQYQLGNMMLEGRGTRHNCELSVQVLKGVSERGSFVHKKLERAFDAYLDGEYASALVDYLTLAEMGVEIAQSNAAFMYDRGLGVEQVHRPQITALAQQAGIAADVVVVGSPAAQSDGNGGAGAVAEADASPAPLAPEAVSVFGHGRALALYKTSSLSPAAAMEANIKIGDYHYYGLGTEVDYELAVAAYKRAGPSSAQALFNIGYMHQHGKGLPLDVHLAKRHYDLALSADAGSSYVAVMLALASLLAQSAFALVTTGSDDLLILLLGEESIDSIRIGLTYDQIMAWLLSLSLVYLLAARWLLQLLVERARRRLQAEHNATQPQPQPQQQQQQDHHHHRPHAHVDGQHQHEQ